MGNIGEWIEKNPWLAGAIGVGGVIVIWWLFFSGSSSGQASNNSGQNNLAAAYYAAEASQAQMGTELQIAQTQATAQTAAYQIQANAATSIASTEGTTQTTLGAQTAAVQMADSNNAYLSTVSNNAAAVQTNQDNLNAGLITSAMGLIVPLETAGIPASQLWTPQIGGGQVSEVTAGAGPTSINELLARGYTQAQALQLVGLG